MHKIPTTIFEQLGGRRFLAMTGAKHFLESERRLQFALPMTPHFVKGKINKVVITLDPSDTYTVEFYRISGVRIQMIATEHDVYAEDLQACFARVTGLETHL